MKRCPECRRDYYDETLLYCLDDGNALLEGPVSGSEPPALAGGFLPHDDGPQTSILSEQSASSDGQQGDAETCAQINTTAKTAVLLGFQPHTASRKTTLIAAALGLIVITSLGIGSYLYYGRGSSKQIDSIAVMPFVNDSGNADVEYLSDGITETLISSLSNLPNLNVKPRSSVFRYKGRDTDSQKIAKELSVQAILNGRVIQRGEDVSLFVELVDVSLDKVVWSKQYSRKQSDLVTLQSDVTRDVSNKLKSQLSGAEVAKIEKNSRVDPEAYQLYLKGLFQLNGRTRASLKQAEELFRHSIEKDANYAPAHVSLGQTLASFPYWSLAEPQDCMPKAKAAADRALELDDSVAGVHNLIGTYLQNYERDWAGAEREYERMIELEPNNPGPYDSLGFLLSYQKRHGEAIAMARRAVELDPVSKRGGLGLALIAAKRFDEAIAELRSGVAVDPNYADTYYYLGIAYLGKGSYPDAIATWNRYLELDNEPVGRAFLAFASAKVGNREMAGKELERLRQESSKSYVAGIAFSLVHLGLGNKDEALDWMKKDVDERSGWASYYTIYPSFNELWGDPRYKDLLKRMNLPE